MKSSEDSSLFLVELGSFSFPSSFFMQSMNMVSGRYIGHVLFAVSVFARFDAIALRSRSFGGMFSRQSIGKKVPQCSVIAIRGGSSCSADSEQLNRTFLGITSPEELQKDSLALYEKLRNCKDAYMSKQLNSALDILDDAMRLYGPEQLFASYNGGKDAVVVLHLLRAVAAKRTADTGVLCRPEFIYFAVKDEFPEVLEHIEETEKMYNLNLRKYETGISQVGWYRLECLGCFDSVLFGGVVSLVMLSVCLSVYLCVWCAGVGITHYIADLRP